MEKIKEIVASFLKIDKNSINNSTTIDRSVIKGSIMIHRMYAAISRELNWDIKWYDRLKTFGDLKERINIGQQENGPERDNLLSKGTGLSQDHNIILKKGFFMGVDIEEIDKMPKVTDFQSDIFYRQNFSEREISYCISQPDPLQSFTGKFAAKEAIVKADNSYRGFPFSEIEIGNDIDGTPYFMDFTVSISHTDKIAIAVVAKIP